MNFENFWAKLKELETSISINSPINLKVKAAYWGAPQGELNDLPCMINALSVPERSVGFGSQRHQLLRINVQLIAAKATVENERSSMIATALWYAAQDVFDADRKIGGTVPLSLLRGAEPTVPVLLTHGAQSFIGFNAFLEVSYVGKFQI